MMKSLFCLLLIVLLPLIPAQATAKSLPEFEPERSGIYNYCPSAFEEDGIRHIYYCTNQKEREITDAIGYRQAKLTEEGWQYSDESIVLEHTRHWSGWDTTHVCDPDVIKGSFHYQGENYGYLMAFLGCKTTNNQSNEIGLAVAKVPGGPFLKLDDLNPFVSFKPDRSTEQKKAIFQWGVGQAALINLDKQGQVALIYTHGHIGGTNLVLERWDLSDLDAPKPLGEQYKLDVSNLGLIGRDLRPTSLNNADAFYDAAGGYIYLIADGWPHYIEGLDASGEPSFISSTLRLLRFSSMISPEQLPMLDLSKGNWTQIGEITPDQSGYPRNSNAGFISDPFGWSLSSDAAEILYSVSEVKQPSHSLWTYRVHRIHLTLGE